MSDFSVRCNIKIDLTKSGIKDNQGYCKHVYLVQYTGSLPWTLYFFTTTVWILICEDIKWQWSWAYWDIYMLKCVKFLVCTKYYENFAIFRHSQNTPSVGYLYKVTRTIYRIKKGLSTQNFVVGWLVVFKPIAYFKFYLHSFLLTVCVIFFKYF